MKSVVIDRFGGPEVLLVKEVPQPVPAANQILVKVKASSVNPIDWKIRSGLLRFLPGYGLPVSLGFDFSGEVLKCGADVSDFKVGDEVFGRSDASTGKAYSEFLAVGAKATAIKPKSLSHLEAAAIPLAALTAYQSLHDLSHIQRGQQVLINGGSGGVGVFAVQLARAAGALTTAVCSGANEELVRSLGADQVIDYKKASPLRKGDMYHCIFDTIGSLSYFQAWNHLFDEGHFVSTLPSPSVVMGIAGSWLTNKKAHFIKCKSRGDQLTEMAELVEKGQLKPIIDSEFPLDKIREAHERSQSGRARGKIVIRV